MNNTFDQQIEAAHQRLETLIQRASGWPEQKSLMAEALEELSAALEELHVAGEELRQQNDELAASRQAVEAERQRYEELFEFAPDGYLVTDPEGVIQEANRAAAALLGVRQDFLVGKPLLVFVADVTVGHAAFHTRLPQLQQAHSDKLQDWQLWLQPREGGPFPVEVTVGRVCDANGRLTGLRWLLRDITDRKQAEEALKERSHDLNERVKELDCLYSISEMVRRNDISQGEILQASVYILALAYQFPEITACRITWGEHDYSTENFRETPWSHNRAILVHGERVGTIQVCYLEERPEEDEEPFLAEERKLVNAVADLLGRSTERKQAEEALRESESIFASFMEYSPVYVFFKDKHTRALRLSKNYERMLGIPANQALGKTMDELFPSDLAKSMVADDLRILNEGRVVHVVEEFNGRVYETTKFPISQAGVPNMLAGFTLDITERKRAEEEIAHLAKFPSENPNPVLRLSQAGVVLYANEASQTLLQEWKCAVGDSVPSYWRGLVAEAVASRAARTVDIECSERVYSLVVSPIAEAGYVNLYGQDITERKQTEDELRRWAHIFEHAEWGVTVGSADGKTFELMNPAFARMHGYTLDELKGQSLFSVFAPEVWADVSVNIKLAHEKGHHVWESIHLRKDGSRFPVLIDVTAVRDEHGEILYRVVNVQDITERKRAEQALRQRNRDLALLNQSSQALVATLDIHEITASLTQAVAEVIGAEGCSVWLHDDKCPGRLVCHGAAYPGQKRSLINLCLEPGEGITGWVAQTGECAIVPQASDDPRFSLKIDGLIGFHTVSVLAVPMRFQDKVTGVLEAVNKQNGDFDTHDCNLIQTLANSAAIAIENARLVEALRQQTTELQARNQELDTFAHTAAHDLKTPLSLIIGYADLFADQPEAALDELRHTLQVIVRNGRKMSNIIDELLLLSEVRSADVPLAPVYMASVLAEVQERFAFDIQERQVEIVLPDASTWPVVWGYAPWIEEVWANYVGNAIKYGGTPPRVELGATPLSNGQVRFWVRDNGRGLAPEDQARLFQPFARLDQARAKGHGLGLSIVRRIVEKLGGQVGVESQIGPGSSFFFTLPSAVSLTAPIVAGSAR